VGRFSKKSEDLNYSGTTAAIFLPDA